MDEHTANELRYKNGYDKGYADGVESATKTAEWKVDEVTRRKYCSACCKYALRNLFGVTVASKHCPECGAKMKNAYFGGKAE